jgi:hypothetical protein
MITRQRMRWMGQLIRSQRVQDRLSHLIWLVSVALFAHWTQTHYHAPADGVPWIGMTIHATVFAIWSQVAREWLSLRWSSHSQKQPDYEQEDL